MSGTSERGANYNLYYDKTALPEGLEAGKTYHLEYEDTSGTDYLRICMYYYAGEDVTEKEFVSAYMPTDFTIPAEAEGLLIRIRVVAAGVKLENAEVKPIIEPVKEVVEADGEPAEVRSNLCPVRTTELTTNGVTFTPGSDGSYIVNGVSERGANYNLYASRTALPKGFEAGKTYYLDYQDTSITDYLHMWICWYDEAGTVEYDLFHTAYSTTFTIPENAVGLLIRLRVVAANVKLDNAVVTPIISEVSSFVEPGPMLSIIDDDGCARFYSDLLPLCVEKGVSISSAVVPTQIEARENGMTKFWMSWDEIRECYAQGIEILSHTYDHASTDTVAMRSIDEIRDSYQLAKDILHQNGIETDILIYSGNTGSLPTSKVAASDVYQFGVRAGGNVRTIMVP